MKAVAKWADMKKIGLTRWAWRRAKTRMKPLNRAQKMNARSNQETERAPVRALAEACRLLVAAIEQVNGKCQTREQRAALVVGREALKKAGTL